jgi:hypothetical protein
MISILHKKDLNKVTPNEISNKIIAHDQFQVGAWAKKQEIEHHLCYQKLQALLQEQDLA